MKNNKNTHILLTLLLFILTMGAVAQSSTFEAPILKQFKGISKEESVISICVDAKKKQTYVATNVGIYLIDENGICKRILENNKITHIEFISDGIREYILVALDNGLISELIKEGGFYKINIDNKRVCYDLTGFFDEKGRIEQSHCRVNKIVLVKTVKEKILFIATINGLYCMYVDSKEHISEDNNYYKAFLKINTIATSITDIINYPTSELENNKKKRNKRELAMSFTTDNGLITLERGEKPKVIRNLKGQNLLSITQEGTEFFLGGNKHLWEYDYSTIGKKVKWRKIKKKIKKDSLSKIGYIAKIVKDKEGNLWLLGTSLCIIQKGFKSLIIYGKHNGNNLNSPTCIATTDSKKKIFVGSLNGLYYTEKYYPEEKEVNILSVKYLRKGSEETKRYKKIKKIKISFEPPENISEREIAFEIFYNDAENMLIEQSVNMAQGGLVVRNDFLPKEKQFIKGYFTIKAWKIDKKTKEKIKELPIKGAVNGRF